MSQKNNIWFLFLLYALGFSGCTEDQLPANPLEPDDCETTMATYSLQVKAIIDESCAYGGCHPGYNRYERLLPILESGIFKARVIDLQDDPNRGMPPDYAPVDRPRMLTPLQLEILSCWLANGYPES